MMGTRVDAVTVSSPCVWSSRWCVPSACKASAGVIARRTVSSPTARGDRRVGALLRQELAGSNPVGGTVHREHPGQREHEGALDTGPAPTVFRSPSFISWPSTESSFASGSRKSAVESRRPAARKRGRARACSSGGGIHDPPYCNLVARYSGSSGFPATSLSPSLSQDRAPSEQALTSPRSGL